MGLWSIAGCQPSEVVDADDDLQFREAPACVTIDGASVADATIRNPPKNNNFGGHSQLIVGSNDESLLRFDLSAIPAGVRVDSATLKLYAHGKAGQEPINIHAATSAWSEGTVSYASFNQQFATPIAGIIQPTSPGALKSASVTGLVTDWLSGTVANHGMLLESGAKEKTTFVSNDAGGNAVKPSLEVCYAVPDTDACDPDPCQNGTCTNVAEGYACECEPGYAGTNCELNIDDCAAAPCQNGGTCTDGVGGYACACRDGFEGANCEINIDECAAAPCLNGGICTDGVAEYTCTCDAGFSGDDCETNIDDCAGGPCQHDGVCTDGAGSYTCACPAGFTGANCETNIDECAGAPCQNGGTCLDRVGAFTCECTPGFSGADCGTPITDCAGGPCLNDGVCSDEAEGFTCACPAGYAGTYCEVDIDDCASNPCQNDGLCVDGVNEYACECRLGFAGATCELPASVWCPQDATTVALASGGTTAQVQGVTVDVTGWSGGGIDMRVAVHGEELNSATPELEEACSGGVIEVLPVGDPGAAVPVGQFRVPCAVDGVELFFEHARSDGSYAYPSAVCTGGVASLDFEGFGHFTLGETVFPGCEQCSPSACAVDSWWPPHGECLALPDTSVEAPIGPAGGVLVHPEGATLTIPAGALAEAMDIDLDVAWEHFPRYEIPANGVRSWRLATHRSHWDTVLPDDTTFTFDCGPQDGRMRVRHIFDFSQDYLVECSGGQATIPLRRFGWVLPMELVDVVTVDGSGGELIDEHGAVVHVPAGALSAPAELSLVTVNDDLAPAVATAALGDRYALLPHGQTFAAPVQVTLPAPGCVEGRTAVLRRDSELDSTWETLSAQCVDDEVHFEVTSFSVLLPIDLVALSNSDCNCLCGEDMKPILNEVAATAITAWFDGDLAKRREACGISSITGLSTPLVGRINIGTWDIDTFYKSENRKFGTQAEIQLSTMTVDGKCYFAGEVNYFLWGVSERLCDSQGFGLPPAGDMAAIWAQRIYAENANPIGVAITAPGRVAWSNAGFDAIVPQGSIDWDVSGPLPVPIGYSPELATVNPNWTAPSAQQATVNEELPAVLPICNPIANDQEYQGFILGPTQPTMSPALMASTPKVPIHWYWGDQDLTPNVFNGDSAVYAPTGGFVCAENDIDTATIGTDLFVEIAINDIGVFAYIPVGVETQGIFTPIAIWPSPSGIPQIQLTSTIPTTFNDTETVVYEYQPTWGGSPETLQALIEIQTQCPIPPSQRPSENNCSCEQGVFNTVDNACYINWPADVTCQVPEVERPSPVDCTCGLGPWDPVYESCTDTCPIPSELRESYFNCTCANGGNWDDGPDECVACPIPVGERPASGECRCDTGGWDSVTQTCDANSTWRCLRVTGAVAYQTSEGTQMPAAGKFWYSINTPSTYTYSKEYAPDPNRAGPYAQEYTAGGCDVSPCYAKTVYIWQNHGQSSELFTILNAPPFFEGADASWPGGALTLHPPYPGQCASPVPEGYLWYGEPGEFFYFGH